MYPHHDKLDSFDDEWIISKKMVKSTISDYITINFCRGVHVRRFLVQNLADNRVITHEAESLADSQKKLLVGYKIVGEIVDNVTLHQPLPDGLPHYTFMTALLMNHGLELVEWLRDNGFQQ